MRTLNYLLEDDSKNKKSLHQFDFIREFIPPNVKHRVFWSLKIDIENTSKNMKTILEDHWYQRSQCIGWIILENISWWTHQLIDIRRRLQTFTVSNVHILKVCTIWFQVSCNILLWCICMLVYIWWTRKVVCGYTWKYIPYEITRIRLLVYVHWDITTQRPLYFNGSG